MVKIAFVDAFVCENIKFYSKNFLLYGITIHHNDESWVRNAMAQYFWKYMNDFCAINL